MLLFLEMFFFDSLDAFPFVLLAFAEDAFLSDEGVLPAFSAITSDLAFLSSVFSCLPVLCFYGRG